MSRIAEIFETMEYGPAPESAAPVEAWLDARGRRFGHYIDGRWQAPAEGEYFDTSDPAHARPLAAVAQGSAADIDAAVKAARAAQPAWAALSGHARARHLYAIARHLQKHSRFFAVLETLDNGKPIRESRDIDIPLVARHFYHHAGWAQLLASEFPRHAPLGVVGQIIPWNFPLLMLAWKIAPALAAGNTVVLKPAEFTPLTALRFAELCDEIGLPPGVVNVVNGDGRTGAALVEHPDVAKIAFTGSTDVGRIIRETTAGSGKKLTLELGGKSPFIVFDDADLDSVVEGVVDAIWFNQGQVCCAGSRLLVQEGIAARLEAKLKARMERLRVGDPLDKAIDIGAIVALVQLARIRELVQQGRDEGAELWQPSWSCPTEGCFYPPTLFTGVSPAATIAQVEIFGPVLVMMTFRTPEEAVALANNSRYGLAASVWSESVNLALDIAPKLRAGTVWVNSTNLFDAAAGFGGVRESGFGREGGREGMFEYLRERWEVDAALEAAEAAAIRSETATRPAGLPSIDRTAKLYIGGKQKRSDSGYSAPVFGHDGARLGEVGDGNRKDIRDAVEAARKAIGWGGHGHGRAQILYYLAENLAARGDEFAARIAALTGASDAQAEVELAIERVYTYAAWADKWDGRVHHTPYRNVTLAMPEAMGVLGIVCPTREPLLGFVSLIAPAMAIGSPVVVVPSQRMPLAATDFYQLLDTSDVPAGAVNIVTGDALELGRVLAAHDDVEGIWYFGPADGGAAIERAAAGNMKRSWVSHGKARDWRDPEQGAGEGFLRQCSHVKNIWVPYGE
jgi:aldehyde dehydrogenase (NAD+)